MTNHNPSYSLRSFIAQLSPVGWLRVGLLCWAVSTPVLCYLSARHFSGSSDSVVLWILSLTCWIAGATGYIHWATERHPVTYAYVPRKYSFGERVGATLQLATLFSLVVGVIVLPPLWFFRSVCEAHHLLAYSQQAEARQYEIVYAVLLASSAFGHVLSYGFKGNSPCDDCRPYPVLGWLPLLMFYPGLAEAWSLSVSAVTAIYGSYILLGVFLLCAGGGSIPCVRVIRD